MSNNSKLTITVNFNLLTIAFIVLKLTKVIDWSWWWVLSPTLIPLGLFLLFCLAWVLVNVFCTGRR